MHKTHIQSNWIELSWILAWAEFFFFFFWIMPHITWQHTSIISIVFSSPGSLHILAQCDKCGIYFSWICVENDSSYTLKWTLLLLFFFFGSKHMSCVYVLQSTADWCECSFCWIKELIETIPFLRDVFKSLRVFFFISITLFANGVADRLLIEGPKKKKNNTNVYSRKKKTDRNWM